MGGHDIDRCVLSRSGHERRTAPSCAISAPTATDARCRPWLSPARCPGEATPSLDLWASSRSILHRNQRTQYPAAPRAHWRQRHRTASAQFTRHRRLQRRDDHVHPSLLSACPVPLPRSFASHLRGLGPVCQETRLARRAPRRPHPRPGGGHVRVRHPRSLPRLRRLLPGIVIRSLVASLCTRRLRLERGGPERRGRAQGEAAPAAGVGAGLVHPPRAVRCHLQPGGAMVSVQRSLARASDEQPCLACRARV